MEIKSKLNRRDFLRANGAAVAATTLPGATYAHIQQSAAPKVCSTNWACAGYDDMASLVGERFRVTASDGRSGVMTLVAAEPVHSGEDRPEHLMRKEGVVAVFDSPDKDWFVDGEHATYRISNARLGAADLFMGRSPTVSGDDVLEIVLN